MSSECHQSVIRVSSECHQSVFRVSSECHQSVIRVSSECHQSVFRVSSEGLQIVFRLMLHCEVFMAKYIKGSLTILDIAVLNWLYTSIGNTLALQTFIAKAAKTLLSCFVKLVIGCRDSLHPKPFAWFITGSLDGLDDVEPPPSLCSPDQLSSCTPFSVRYAQFFHLQSPCASFP